MARPPYHICPYRKHRYRRQRCDKKPTKCKDCLTYQGYIERGGVPKDD